MNLDKERTSNPGKGFGSLMGDDGGKADVKDEDALKLIQATQKNLYQKHHSFNGIESVGQKSFSRIDAPQDYGFYPSETTLSNSRMCKQYLENKYHVIFKIINNNDVYNPLLVVKNRKVDVNNEGINDHSSISVNKVRQSINRGKTGGSASRRKTPNPWHVTHMEIIKDYEQRNNISDMSTSFKNSDLESSSYNNVDHVPQNSLLHMGSELVTTKKNLPYRRLSQIFVPPSQEKEESRLPTEGGRRGGKHSRTLSLNEDITSPLTKDDHQSKSKRGLLSIFKRKDRKHNKRGRSDTEIDDNGDGQVGAIKELVDHSSSLPTINLSSGDPSPKSSSEDVRPLPEKDKDFLSISNNVNVYHSNNDLAEYGVKYDNEMLKKPNRDTLIVLSDDTSMYAGSSNGSSARHSMEFDSIKNTQMDIYLSSHSTSEALHVEDHLKKLSEDENVNNKIIDNSSESEEDTKDDELDEDDNIDETINVDLDVLPPNLRKLYQKENSRYVELNIRSNDDFKFNKFVRRKSRSKFELDKTLYDLRISLVGDASHNQKRINQNETSLLIERCDDYIKEATELFNKHEQILLDKEEIIVKNNYRSFSSQSLTTEGYHTPMVYELKKNIDEKTKSLNGSLINIENTANKLKTQHNSISEEMKAMFETFEDISLSVNHDYFHELKILEDNIHILVSESGKSLLSDIFYLMLSYVLA
ncbi:2023_t:CDS:10, partial [Dentiscutata heterogama]